MLHSRSDGQQGWLQDSPSHLSRPSSSHGRKGEVLDNEVLEIMSDPSQRSVKVTSALGREGWLPRGDLHACPEGFDGLPPQEISFAPLAKGSQRWTEVQQLLQSTKCGGCSCSRFSMEAMRIWFITGHYLGATGLKDGPKELLFHGCKDAAAWSVAQQGLDIGRASGKGAWGKGLYFSPQSCKACSYSERFLLVFEVALGSKAQRLTMTTCDKKLNWEGLRRKGKISVQSHAGELFHHEERVIYRSNQCKPVYLIEFRTASPGGGQ